MRNTVRRLFHGLPPSIQATIQSVRHSRAVRRRLRPVRWGSLRRLEPVSARWGSERGRPVDRHYIDAFLAKHAQHISGRVLEVRDAGYTRKFGRNVSTIDVVDIDPRNDDATIVADLADQCSLPSSSFDCVIVPQTLVYVRDLTNAVANLWQSLAPRGTLLVTVPAISRVDPDSPAEDRWHLMPAGLEELIRRACAEAEFSIEAGGNPLVATAFLQGISAGGAPQGRTRRPSPAVPDRRHGRREEARAVKAEQALILTYHRIRHPGRDPLLQCVDPEHFADQLRRLPALAEIVPLAELREPARGRRIALTFDDGYADNAAVAVPALRSAGLPATFFVPQPHT